MNKNGYESKVRRIKNGKYDAKFANPSSRTPKRKKGLKKGGIYTAQTYCMDYQKKYKTSAGRREKEPIYYHELETGMHQNGLRYNQGQNEQNKSQTAKNAAPVLIVAVLLCIFLSKLEGPGRFVTAHLAQISAGLLPLAQLAFAVGIIMLLVFGAKKNRKMTKIGGMLLMAGFTISSFHVGQTSVGIVLIAIIYILGSGL